MRAAALCGLTLAATLASATLDDFTAQSALIMDADTGRIVWAKDGDVRRYPASTTKIMTAMVLLERARPEEVVTISAAAAKTKGSGIRLRTGEKFYMKDLLTAILVKSANGACEAAAEYVAGKEAVFVQFMNQKAESIGALCTHFANPHGLHAENHYTTAHDLALIASQAMKDPEFRRIVGIKEAYVGPIGKTPIKIHSTNALLGVDPTNSGIKTGWTNPAGRCFVGWHEDRGMRLVTVVLGCKKWEPDQKALMSWFWESFEKKQVCHKGDVLTSQVVPGSLGGSHQFNAVDTVEAIVPKALGAPIITMKPDLKAPLSPGDIVGTADYGGGIKVELTPASFIPSQLQVGAGVSGAAVTVAGVTALTIWRTRRK